MTPNPCYECVCAPVCGPKHWAKRVMECSRLKTVLYRMGMEAYINYTECLKMDLTRTVFRSKYIEPTEEDKQKVL